MSATRLMRRRARAHVGLLALVGLQVALSTAAVAGATGYVTLAERDGLATTLAATAPQDAAVRIHASLPDDHAAQDLAATAVLDEHLVDLPVTVHRSLATVALPAQAARTPAASADAADGTDEPDSLGTVTLWYDAALPDAARLTEGTWPDAAATSAAPGTPEAPAPTTVHADAAERMGLAVGDTFVVVTGLETTRTLEVVGLWLPTDPADTRWFDDPLVRQGATDDGAATGPFAVTERLLVGLENARTARWTLVPEPGALLPADVPALRVALAHAIKGLDDDEAVDARGLTTFGHLDATLANLEARLGGVRGVTTAAVLLVVLTGLIALAQMARLLADVRLPETVVLRSRGTTISQVVAASALEAAAVGAIGALVGAGVAGVALRPLGDPPLALLVATASVAALATAAVLAWRAGSHAVGVVRRGRSDAAGRNQRAVGAGAVGLAALGAVLAWWQLDRYGSPIFTGADGRVHVDPLGAAAVALVLLALGLAAVLLLVPTAGLVASRAQRRRDLMPVLALRELARHTPVHAVAVVLVVLAVGAGTVAAGYAGTLRGWRSDVGRAATGADLRLDVAPAPTGAATLAQAVRLLPDVDDARPVRTLPLGTRSATGELVGVVGGVGSVDGTDDDAAAPGLPVPAGTAAISLVVTVDAGEDDPRLTARVWFADHLGDLVVVDAEPVTPSEDAPPTGRAWTVPVPGDPSGSAPGRTAPAGAWAVVAVDVEWTGLTPVVDATVAPADVTATLTGLTADDGTSLLAGAETWTAVHFAESGGVGIPAVGRGVTVDGFAARTMAGAPVRLLPGASAPLEVTVTAGWRDGIDLDLGDAVVMRVDGVETDVVLRGDVLVVPGSAAAAEVSLPGAPALLADDDDPASRLAAVADLHAVTRLLLERVAEVPAADAVWISTDRPDAVAAAAATAGAAVDGTTAERVVGVRDPAPGADRLATPPLVATGLAAAFALVVMVPGVAATALTLALARRRETAVLRALGVGPTAQVRARRAEMGVVVGAAVVVGALAGLLVTWLCVPALVRATVPGPVPLPVVVAIDPIGLAATVGGAAALLVAVLAGYGVAVGRQARAGADLEDRW